MTLIPLVVVIMGFAASFFHLASPLHAPGVFAGVGGSPLSNEILVGAIFTVLAVVYVVCALTGRLSGGARKVLVVVVAASALVFACFTGLAYVMETIASWNSPLSRRPDSRFRPCRWHRARHARPGAFRSVADCASGSV